MMHIIASQKQNVFSVEKSLEYVEVFGKAEKSAKVVEVLA